MAQRHDKSECSVDGVTHIPVQWLCACIYSAASSAGGHYNTARRNLGAPADYFASIDTE